MKEQNEQVFEAAFGNLFAPDLIEAMAGNCKIGHFKKDDIVIDIGMPIDAMPLVIEGALKVMREDDEYRELLLYYLEGGDTCTMSMSCCFEHKKSSVRAIAEEDAVIAFVPSELATQWLTEFPDWRQYIFNAFQLRVEELLGAVDMLAFLKMDERILRYLKKLSDIQSSSTVSTTHRQIAEDLNTSRVVVSRVLKDLEKKGRVSIDRHSIQLH